MRTEESTAPEYYLLDGLRNVQNLLSIATSLTQYSVMTEVEYCNNSFVTDTSSHS